MAKSKFTAGDRIAYAASFLKSISAGRDTAQRRGTYLGPFAGLPGYSRMRWDDEETMLAACDQDDDYKADIRAHGSLICDKNIARVGSVRFADAAA